MREVARVMPMEIVGDLKRHEGCPMTQSRVRILVVDDERNIDERNIRKNLGMVLEAKGYKVDTSGNGDDALRRIKDEYYDLDKADVVICIGYDMVEYHPEEWNPDCGKTIVHIDASAAEADEHYIVEVVCSARLGKRCAPLCGKRNRKAIIRSRGCGGRSRRRCGPMPMIRAFP
jgi:hypothetical protein